MDQLPNNTTVLVTGATGILGRVIALKLLKQGKSVKATKRKHSNLEDVKASFRFYTDDSETWFEKIQWINVDFEDINALENALENISEVYHCAAKVSFHPKDRNEMYQTNIEGTKNLLYACDGSSVEKFCFVSSVAVLDGFNDDGFQDEDSNYNSKLAHSTYAKSKHFSEMEVWRAAAEGLNMVIVNPGIIIGTGNWKSSSGEMFGQLANSAYSTDGSSGYVDVRDVADIAINLMDQNIFDQRFVLTSENIKNKIVADKVRKAVGKSSVKIVPKSVLNIGRGLNFLLGWLIPSLKMANKVNIDAITTDSKLSSQKIKNQLNYQFIPVEESLDFHLTHYLQDHQ